MAPTIPLDYCGPVKTESASLIGRIARGFWLTLIAAIFLAVVIIRAVLLAGGYACVFAGTVFLFIGGRRSAGATLRRWRGYWSEHLRLWCSDILRPLRALRRSKAPQRVLDPLMLPS